MAKTALTVAIYSRRELEEAQEEWDPQWAVQPRAEDLSPETHVDLAASWKDQLVKASPGELGCVADSPAPILRSPYP